MASTKIEWTRGDDGTPGKVWNPVKGCEPVSEGCRNCYASRFAHRFSGPGQKYEGLTRLTKSGPKWNGEVRLVPEMLEAPLRWKKPRRIFVNSMSDLFHKDVSNEFIAAVFGVMAVCPQHTFQLLTKRPERMLEWEKWLCAETNGHPPVKCLQIASRLVGRDLGAVWKSMMVPGQWLHPQGPWPLKNVWHGVSAEDQKTADERIPVLLEVLSEVPWVSIEPMLGPIDMKPYLVPSHHRIQWIVCGGESGYGARPMNPDWVRSIRDQCQEAKVPFLMKQWGAWKPHSGTEKVAHDITIDLPPPSPAQTYTASIEGQEYIFVGHEWGWTRKVSKKEGGRELDGRIWNEYPQV